MKIDIFPWKLQSCGNCIFRRNVAWFLRAEVIWVIWLMITSLNTIISKGNLSRENVDQSKGSPRRRIYLCSWWEMKLRKSIFSPERGKETNPKGVRADRVTGLRGCLGRAFGDSVTFIIVCLQRVVEMWKIQVGCLGEGPKAGKERSRWTGEENRVVQENRGKRGYEGTVLHKQVPLGRALCLIITLHYTQFPSSAWLCSLFCTVGSEQEQTPDGTRSEGGPGREDCRSKGSLNWVTMCRHLGTATAHPEATGQTRVSLCECHLGEHAQSCWLDHLLLFPYP